eukprot:jgi/Tetstr1/446309/TSEL_033853.t1
MSITALLGLATLAGQLVPLTRHAGLSCATRGWEPLDGARLRGESAVGRSGGRARREPAGGAAMVAGGADEAAGVPNGGGGGEAASGEVEQEPPTWIPNQVADHEPSTPDTQELLTPHEPVSKADEGRRASDTQELLTLHEPVSMADEGPAEAQVVVSPEAMSIPPPPTYSIPPREAPLQAVPETLPAAADMEPLSPEELTEFAEYLGMAAGEDGRYLWIAEQALCAPLPEGCREVEDHLGTTFYLLTDEDTGEVTTSWEHPYDEFYRQVFAGLKARQWDLITRNEMLEMAAFLGLDPSKHAPLMWIPQQAAIAPLPAGWEERHDDKGVFYVNEESGFSSRAHPLDVVFQTVASVERRRLEAGEFSLVRAAALGEASGTGPSLALRLVEEDGSAAYTYDWLRSRRVGDDGAPSSSATSPFADIQRQLSLSKAESISAPATPAGHGGLTINTRANGPQRMLSGMSSAELEMATVERTVSAEQSEPGTPDWAAANVSPSALLAQRVPLVSRQSGVSTPKGTPKGSARSRFATQQGQRPVRKRPGQPRMRPFEHYPTGLPATRKPEGWQMLNPAALWVWGAYHLWAWALVLPVVRRVLPKPPDR